MEDDEAGAPSSESDDDMEYTPDSPMPVQQLPVAVSAGADGGEDPMMAHTPEVNAPVEEMLKEEQDEDPMMAYTPGVNAPVEEMLKEEQESVEFWKTTTKKLQTQIVALKNGCNSVGADLESRSDMQLVLNMVVRRNS